MKKLLSYLLFGILAGSFTACSDENYSSRLKELIIEDMTFDSSKSTQELVFRHEDMSNYECKSSEDWCTAAFDVANSKLIVNVQANNTYDPRTATITLADKIDGTLRAFTINQSRNTGLFIGETLFEISMYGGSATVELESNVEYEVVIPSDCDWVTLDNETKTRGLEKSSFTLNVSENKSYKERKAFITVINKDENLSGTVTITQPFETVFKADKTSFILDMDGGIVSINMESNIDYEIVIPEESNWIKVYEPSKTREVASSTVMLKVDENKSYNNRDGIVYLRNNDAGAEILIFVHQTFSAVLNTDDKTFEVGMEGGTVTVNMESNITYDVNIPEDCDWVTQAKTNKTKAVTTSTVTLNVAENKSYQERDVVVTISNYLAGVSVPITIHQAFITIFKADKTDFDVDMEGGNVTVNLESNISYDVEIPSEYDWITISSGARRNGFTRATTNSTLAFKVKENTTYKNREAIITITNKEAEEKGACKPIKIAINQPFNTIFKADKTDFDIDMEGGSITVNMESNISYDVEIPSDCDWITRPASIRQAGNTKAATTSSVVLRVNKNSSYKDRGAVITITNKDAEKEGACKPIKIAIHQPFNTIFKADKTDFDVDMSGGSITVNMESNIKYDVDTGCDWVTFQTNSRENGATRATSTSALVFRVKENTSYNARDAIVTISNKEANRSIKIYIHQSFNTTFKVDKTDFEVSQDGGSVTINLESNITFDVNVPSDCDWITKASSSRTRAANTYAIVLHVKENTTYKNRETSITITNKEAEKKGACKPIKIAIRQPFNTVFKADKTDFDVAMSGGSVTVNMESNIKYDVDTGCDWVTFQKNTRTNGVTRATSTSAIVLRVKENNNYDARDAVVTISNKEAQKEGAIDGPIKIYIHQQPFVATLKVDKSELEVGTDGGAVSVNVESNVDFNVIMPSGCDWISQGNSARRTRASKTSVVTFNVSKNTSGQERSATIIISNTTAKVSSSVKITQKFSSTFNVNETPLEIDELGGNLGIHVAANVDVSVETDKSWLSVGGKTNVGNGYWTQQITVQPLKTKVAQRKGKVTFLYNQTGQSFNVEITQNRLLYITESEITLTAKDESKPLTLNNPENMEVKWSSSDTKVAKVSSQGKVTAVGNGTAEITVKSSDGKYSDKVKVTVEIEEGE